MVPSAGSAASSEMTRINRERNRVESNLKELRKQLDEYQSKLRTIKTDESRSIDALKNIRKQIQVHERLIAENQVLLENLDGELDRLQNQLAENRESYHHVSNDFQRVVVAAYKHGGDRNAELMFSSGSVNDAVVRSKYMGFLSHSVRSRVTDLQSSAQQMESSRAQLQQTYREKAQAIKAQQVQLQSYSSKKKEKEDVLSGIKKDKKEYASRILEVRRKQRQMQARIESLIMAQQELIRREQERNRLEALRRQRLAAIQAAERQRKAAESARAAQAAKTARQLKSRSKAVKPPSSFRSEEVSKLPVRPVPEARTPVTEPVPEVPVTETPVPETPREAPPVVIDFTEREIDRVSADFDAGSSLPWPVSNGVVVRRFGSSLDRELNIVTISNGIDISVPVGSQVKSVSGGKVVQITYLPSFGNVVIVRHPKSYLTVYANLARVSVARGDLIRSRQLLGTSAAMPEGGSIVHFEIWKGKAKQNPQRWLR
jgi:septal ring factor EnvC (AmiA/AmiB activator)